MPTTDLMVWLLGIYGISKVLYEMNYRLLNNNLNISDFSFLTAVSLVYFYFPAEIFLTKTLICFATGAFSFCLARIIDDEY